MNLSNFHIDNLHYFDKKLFNEANKSITIFDWQKILNQRKTSFPNHYFIVVEDKKCLFIDTFLLSLFKIEYKEDCININVDATLKENKLNLYILQIHQKEQCLKINSYGEEKINIFHENIISQKGHSFLEINNDSDLDYYYIDRNTSEQLFHSEISLNSKNNLNFFLMHKNQKSKVKLDLQAKIFKDSELTINVLNYLETHQLKDDSIEIYHLENDSTSIINYLSLNGGKSVSQINSVINENVENCETHQKIKHIILNDKAQSFSKPNLMIKNPNVIASHGNSIGSFSKEHLFYLQQRGFSLEEAKNIINKSMIEHFCENTIYSSQLKSYFEGINI